MSRAMKMTLAVLLLCVAAGAVYFRLLHERVLELTRSSMSEQQAMRAIAQPDVTTPSDVKVKAKMFWASPEAPGALAPVEVELPLSADPVLRAKQVLAELVSGPPSPAQRTLPEKTILLEFYLLPDGTAVADFSAALGGELPSGILSEDLAVDSIARTLEANVPQATRLKILIGGQEADTLAGHLDLSGFFPLQAAGPVAPQRTQSPAPDASPQLTPATVPGKLKPATP